MSTSVLEFTGEDTTISVFSGNLFGIGQMLPMILGHKQICMMKAILDFIIK